jgi:hypothetical protein
MHLIFIFLKKYRSRIVSKILNQTRHNQFYMSRSATLNSNTVLYHGKKKKKGKYVEDKPTQT